MEFNIAAGIFHPFATRIMITCQTYVKDNTDDEIEKPLLGLF